jgi:hypothetical protein
MGAMPGPCRHLDTAMVCTRMIGADVRPKWKEGPGRMALSPDQRDVPRHLSRSPRGSTQSILLAHGFATRMLRDLVRNGLATADREIVRSGRRIITVTCMWITDARRRALADHA